MIERAAAGAGLELKAHPHMLRHACGYALANNGHDTRAIRMLGHRSIGRFDGPRATHKPSSTGRSVDLTWPFHCSAEAEAAS
jgi:integrase